MAAPPARQRVVMGWRGTAVLALLVLVLGAYVCLEAVPPDPGDSAAMTEQSAPQQATTPTHHLLEFEPADVVSLRLERAGQFHETRRAASGWQGIGNATALDDLVHDLAELGMLMDIPGSQTALKDYGLEPPQGTLEIRLRSRTTPLLLQIGDRNPAITGVYVRTGTDGPVALAGALIEWDFDRAFKALAELG
ncbi:MAG TPA: DUF4340 domain-containing protein [Candidatus Acidoferrales bacterium]|nr:DUF4340 domain-containing protein [Candidatus Acidoferrales bacterium]